MKMVKKLVLASVALPIALGATSVFAAAGKDEHKDDHKRPPMPRYAHCHPGFNQGIFRHLGLTTAQKQQLKDLVKAEKKAQKLHMEDQTKEMNSLLLADKFDPAKAAQIAQKMDAARISHQVTRFEEEFKMLAVLTPAQKAKYVELEKKEQAKCGAEMHHKDKEHKEGVEKKVEKKA